MSQKEIFAGNLKRLVDSSPLSRREVAERAGVSYGTLGRWLQVGLEKPDQRSRKPLQKICRLFRVQLKDLWADYRDSHSELYAQKVKEMLDLWEELGLDYDSVAGWIDQWYTAAHVAQRFRRQEPDLTEIVAQVKSLETDGEVQMYLEELLREWNLDEAGSYKRLIETTQRFLAALIPHDPEQLGLWFKEVHSRRWTRLLDTGKLDNEGELIAFVRHMMAEGLSAHEAYEGLIRLSNESVPDTPRKKRATVSTEERGRAKRSRVKSWQF